MKILSLGSRFFGGQVDRIDQGFVELGHELVTTFEEADLVYSNDGGSYKEIITNKEQGKIKGKIILNVLDIPEHLFPKVDLKELKANLDHADAICAISKFVQWQLNHYLAKNSSVIYQPIKPIARKFDPLQGKVGIRFASIGRRTDPNKRFPLAVMALQTLGINYNQLGLVGNEYIGWGNFFGVLSDAQLNDLYNGVDFVLATGKVEGLNLPVLEAMAAGCIPVVINDMTTRKELLPPDLFPEYDDVKPTVVEVAKFIAIFMQDNDAMAKMKDRLYDHYVKNWQKNTSSKGVANKIIEVYKTL